MKTKKLKNTNIEMTKICPESKKQSQIGKTEKSFSRYAWGRKACAASSKIEKL